MPRSFKYYMPSIYFLAIAAFIYTFNGLTIFLLTSLFIFLAVLYTIIIYRMRQGSKVQSEFQYDQGQQHSNDQTHNYYYSENPSFKNIAGDFVKNQKWTKDIFDVTPDKKDD